MLSWLRHMLSLDGRPRRRKKLQRASSPETLEPRQLLTSSPVAPLVITSLSQPHHEETLIASGSVESESIRIELSVSEIRYMHRTSLSNGEIVSEREEQGIHVEVHSVTILPMDSGNLLDGLVDHYAVEGWWQPTPRSPVLQAIVRLNSVNSTEPANLDFMRWSAYSRRSEASGIASRMKNDLRMLKRFEEFVAANPSLAKVMPSAREWFTARLESRANDLVSNAFAAEFLTQVSTQLNQPPETSGNRPSLPATDSPSPLVDAVDSVFSDAKKHPEFAIQTVNLNEVAVGQEIDETSFDQSLQGQIGDRQLANHLKRSTSSMMSSPSSLSQLNAAVTPQEVVNVQSMSSNGISAGSPQVGHLCLSANRGSAIQNNIASRRDRSTSIVANSTSSNQTVRALANRPGNSSAAANGSNTTHDESQAKNSLRETISSVQRRVNARLNRIKCAVENSIQSIRSHGADLRIQLARGFRNTLTELTARLGRVRLTRMRLRDRLQALTRMLLRYHGAVDLESVEIRMTAVTVSVSEENGHAMQRLLRHTITARGPPDPRPPSKDRQGRLSKFRPDELRHSISPRSPDWGRSEFLFSHFSQST